jgi:hypothetical protein
MSLSEEVLESNAFNVLRGKLDSRLNFQPRLVDDKKNILGACVFV